MIDNDRRYLLWRGRMGGRLVCLLRCESICPGSCGVALSYTVLCGVEPSGGALRGVVFHVNSTMATN